MSVLILKCMGLFGNLSLTLFTFKQKLYPSPNPKFSEMVAAQAYLQTYHGHHYLCRLKTGESDVCSQKSRRAKCLHAPY